jgi:hypothetical protein
MHFSACSRGGVDLRLPLQAHTILLLASAFHTSTDCPGGSDKPSCFSFSMVESVSASLYLRSPQPHASWTRCQMDEARPGVELRPLGRTVRGQGVAISGSRRSK